MSEFIKLKIEFDSLNEKEQWLWAIKHKNGIELVLDNDNTTFVFKYEDKTDDCTLCMFKSDIGNREGALLLLSCIGISAKYV